MTDYTISPGPWRHLWTADAGGVVVDRDGVVIATGAGGEHDIANRQLMALAPELVTALESLLAAVDAGMSQDMIAQQGYSTYARRALARVGVFISE